MKSFLSFLLVFSLGFVHAQDICTAEEVHALVKTIQDKHYSPKPLDDNFSEKLFFKYLQTLDERHLYFTKAEINLFLTSKYNLSHELLNKKLTFIEEITPSYRNGLQRAKRILESLKRKEWKIIRNEKYLPHYKDSLDYASSDTDLIERWEKYVKLQVLIKEYQLRTDSTASKIPISDLYRKTIDRFISNINSDIKENSNSLKHLYYQYAKCLPLLNDAHSNYFSYSDYQNFQSALSTEDYKFGITIEKNDIGEVAIVRLTPGSPAWKSNKINIGDIITYLKWEHGEKVEVAGMELSEVSGMMNQFNDQWMDFTIRSATGTVQILSMKKEKITTTDNMVKGFVLVGKDKRKIGYISLPSFYTLWESENMLGCANDVAKELVKLKQENIEGLLFDLRNNGGGSLKEGLELSGIFINEGALAMQRLKGQAPAVLKDWNRGSAYDGPMVVLINGHSASASELMASTLQDFNRAVLVGCDSYGKATGQELFSLNPAEILAADSLRPGYATITMLKLYRITGKSNQLTGVKPDIVLPDPYVNLYERESKQEEVLPRDSVSKKTYYQPLPALPVSKLKLMSEQRIKQNNNFAEMQSLSKQYQTVFEPFNQEVFLSQEGVKAVYKNYEDWSNRVKKYNQTETNSFQVETTSSDKSLNQLSEDDRVFSEYSKKRIKTDLTLEESFFILNDLIQNK